VSPQKNHTVGKNMRNNNLIYIAVDCGQNDYFSALEFRDASVKGTTDLYMTNKHNLDPSWIQRQIHRLY